MKCHLRAHWFHICPRWWRDCGDCITRALISLMGLFIDGCIGTGSQGLSGGSRSWERSILRLFLGQSLPMHIPNPITIPVPNLACIRLFPSLNLTLSLFLTLTLHLPLTLSLTLTLTVNSNSNSNAVHIPIPILALCLPYPYPCPYPYTD